MVALTPKLPSFARVDASTVRPADPAGRVQLNDSQRQFSSALASALNAQAAARSDAAAAAPSANGSATPAKARARARRTLELGEKAASEPPSAGDVVLSGLQKLRGVFNAEQSRMLAAMSGPVITNNKLIDLQMEVSRFSLLLDVSAKLAGKSTSTFDTLLKSQ